MASSVTVFKGSPTGKIIQSANPKPALAGAQVLVEIHHAGLCGTDLHYLHLDMVIGHEGAGVVKELGPKTRYLKMCVVQFSNSSGSKSAGKN
jgi:threonine dehydrogenase-like Zn-dependent dehydrogenase